MNSYGLTISIKIILILSKMKELTVTPFTILVKGAQEILKTAYGI